MPELKRKTACAQCPFRKDSFAGYLGASTADEFLDQTLKDAPMPCHMAIDYSEPDWAEEQLPTADLCVGALQFQNNFLKLPRPPELSAAARKVGKNPRIMSTPEEFLERHDNDLNRKFVETAQKMEPGVKREY